MIDQVVIIIHVVVAVAITAIILIQQGKGAEMGASFGSGASQTVFGSGGNGNFFVKVTALLATIFFITSFALAVLAKEGSKGEAIDIPQAIESRETVNDEMPTAVLDEELPTTVEEKAAAVSDEEIPMADEVEATVEEEIPAE